MSWMEVLYGGIIIGVTRFLWREYVYPRFRRPTVEA